MMIWKLVVRGPCSIPTWLGIFYCSDLQRRTGVQRVQGESREYLSIQGALIVYYQNTLLFCIHTTLLVLHQRQVLLGSLGKEKNALTTKVRAELFAFFLFGLFI